MYNTIMVPIDLAHQDKLDKAISTAADISKCYGANLHFVGVTGSALSAAAHNEAEFASKLEAFAKDQSSRLGVEAAAKAMHSNDPAIDLDATLEKAATELDADLIVMGSHVPGFMEHVISSNAGYLATHSKVSVFVVR